MRRRYLLLLWAGLLEGSACGTGGPTASETASKPAPLATEPAAPPAAPMRRDTLAPAAAMVARAAAITTDYATWYSYAYYQVPLFRKFRGLSAAGQPLAKKAFLRQLATGKYVVLQRGTQAGYPVYQLYTFTSTPAEVARIKAVSQQLAETELANYTKEGQPMPPFRLTDLAGKTYTPASTRGKVLVIKCWFIHCVPCVKEFSEVNALANRYQTNPDVQFISLATDDAAKLRPFLASHPLRYATVPASTDFMQRQLGVQAYPAHIVVGRDGKISFFSYSRNYLPAAIEEALQSASRPPPAAH